MNGNERFWRQVESSPEGCWIWAGSTLSGYGQFYVRGEQGRKTVAAHRYSYSQMIGEIPSGLELDHLCRNRACVNPYHLDPVPHAVNMQRSPLLGQGNGGRTHCKHGHEFTPENTRVVKQSYGRGEARVCRRCTRIRAQRYRNVQEEGTA